MFDTFSENDLKTLQELEREHGIEIQTRDLTDAEFDDLADLLQRHRDSEPVLPQLRERFAYDAEEGELT